MDDRIRQRLLIDCLAQMAKIYLEQKRNDASAKVEEPAADASDGQSPTDLCSYDSTAQPKTQAEAFRAHGNASEQYEWEVGQYEGAS
jgi:hypothetical protein